MIFVQAMDQVQMSCTSVCCLCMKALLPVGGWVSKIYIRNLFLENVIYCKCYCIVTRIISELKLLHLCNY